MAAGRVVGRHPPNTDDPAHAAKRRIATYLQHVQKSRLSRIVEAQEKELGVLVKQSQRGQHIVDYSQHVSAHFAPMVG